MYNFDPNKKLKKFKQLETRAAVLRKLCNLPEPAKDANNRWINETIIYDTSISGHELVWTVPETDSVERCSFALAKDELEIFMDGFGKHCAFERRKLMKQAEMEHKLEDLAQFFDEMEASE